MRTLVIAQNVALDGAIELLDDWFVPSEEPDPEHLALTRRQDRQTDACLLVRRAFEDFHGHWLRPLAAAEPRHDSHAIPTPRRLDARSFGSGVTHAAHQPARGRTQEDTP